MKKQNKILILIMILAITSIVTGSLLQITKENPSTALGEKNTIEDTPKEDERLDSSDQETIENQDKIEDIPISKEKVPIYFFWGEGCPHCEELFAFFESIQESYGSYFELHSFEIWQNEENGKIKDQFAYELGDKVGSRSVPYFIIKDKSFSGYRQSMNQTIINTILEKYQQQEKEDFL